MIKEENNSAWLEAENDRLRKLLTKEGLMSVHTKNKAFADEKAVLIAEVERLKKLCHRIILDWRELVVEKNVRIAYLEEVLEKYGGHTELCNFKTGDGVASCTCGWLYP